jgi:predicted nucleic acid-binding protein
VLSHGVAADAFGDVATAYADATGGNVFLQPGASANGLAGALAEGDADAAFAALLAAEITYVGVSEALLQAAWAVRHNVSAYDVAYLAIAAEYGARLVTFDTRLAKAAEQVAPLVSVLAL